MQAITVSATLKSNEAGRRPKYNVDDHGIVGSLYLARNEEGEEPADVPETLAVRIAQPNTKRNS